MVKITLTIFLIFSLFFLCHARIYTIKTIEAEEDLFVELDEPSKSNYNLPYSNANSNEVGEDDEAKILLPSQRPKEDVEVLSEEVDDLEPASIEEDLNHHHHHHHHHHHRHRCFPFHFRFRFPFLFRSHCHHHHRHHHHHHHHHDHHGNHSHGNHSHSHHHHHHHHHHKNHTEGIMEENDQMEAEMSYGDDMIISGRKIGNVHHHKPCNHSEEVMDFEESKMKHHHKKHSCLIKWFKKLFKHFH